MGGATADTAEMPGSGEDAVLRYYAHGGEDVVPVVVDALRDPERVDVDDLAGTRARFVVSADELRATFAAAALEPVVWNEQEAALGAIAEHRFDPTVDPGQVGLDLLMPRFEVRMANVGRSIGEGQLRLLQAVLHAV
jgi:hypothetical protein